MSKNTSIIDSNLEKYLLCLGNNKYCLLIFDPNLISDDFVHLDAVKGNANKSINLGFGKWRLRMNNAIDEKNRYLKKNNSTVKSGLCELEEVSFLNGRFSNHQLLEAIDPKLIKFGINNSEWPIIVCKPPEKIFTCFRPNTSHKVMIKEKESFKSLAGVYTRNVDGIFGATICLHCFPNSQVEIGKTKVIINGIDGTVISANSISDSCFVKLEVDESRVENIINIKGPLYEITPREFEKCYFINRMGKKPKLT